MLSSNPYESTKSSTQLVINSMTSNEGTEKLKVHTEYINGGAAVAKPSGWSIRKVDTIWLVVDFSSSIKHVVVATISQ